MRLRNSPAVASGDLHGISPGIFPYLGGSADEATIRDLVAACGEAVLSGKRGAQQAALVPGVLVDPALYSAEQLDAPPQLLDFDEWLERQRAAEVPVILTDTPRIQNKDRAALRRALTRWETTDRPTWVVLPIESWWLRDGLAWLADEVKSAGRPVALVLMHAYNGLDAPDAISGLLKFISAVDGLQVTMLRCDVSAIGAVAHGAFGGFIGCSTTSRHGRIPVRRREQDGDDEPDRSPSVFVPSLHDYMKSSRLPALARGDRASIARCDDSECNGRSLLRISQLSESDLTGARKQANLHNAASAEILARRVLAAEEPRDTWWEHCKMGAITAASLTEVGISLPVKPWLRQWLEAGSPAHHPETVR